MQIMFAVFLDLWSPISFVLAIPSHTFLIWIMSVMFLDLWSSAPLDLSVPSHTFLIWIMSVVLLELWSSVPMRTFLLQFLFVVFLVLWLTVLIVLSVRSGPLLVHFCCVSGVLAFCIISSVSIADSVCCISKIFLRSWSPVSVNLSVSRRTLLMQILFVVFLEFTCINNFVCS